MKNIIKLLIITAVLLSTTGIANAAYLSVGSRGGELADLQGWLIENGFPIPLIESGKAPSGYFGEQTRNAVMMYQESKGIRATGSIDSATVFTSTDPILGAVSTLDGVDNPYMSVNGVKTYFYNQNIAATSSVPCSIRNPFNATSTLVRYSVQALTSGLGVQVVDVSTSTTAFASSSPAFLRITTPSVGYELAWNGGTTTSILLIGTNRATGATDAIIGPSEFVNLRIATTSAGTFTNYFNGTCKGVFQAL